VVGPEFLDIIYTYFRLQSVNKQTKTSIAGLLPQKLGFNPRVIYAGVSVNVGSDVVLVSSILSSSVIICHRLSSSAAGAVAVSYPSSPE
jgi:hypothetical protein